MSVPSCTWMCFSCRCSNCRAISSPGLVLCDQVATPTLTPNACAWHCSVLCAWARDVVASLTAPTHVPKGGHAATKQKRIHWGCPWGAGGRIYALLLRCTHWVTIVVTATIGGNIFIWIPTCARLVNSTTPLTHFNTTGLLRRRVGRASPTVPVVATPLGVV